MSDKRQEACTDADGPPPPQLSLPVDILLEFALRADVATLVRFAATSKSLRRGILSPDFRRRLLALREETGRWFDPALLRGVTYGDITSGDPHVIGTPQSAPLRVRVHQGILTLLEPVASRDGFLIMRSRVINEHRTTGQLLVCDTFTGRIIRIPAIGLSAERRRHTPAVLAVDGADRSFELLVANRDLEFQTFSSRTGQWSAVRAVSGRQPVGVSSHRAHPAVVGRTVHWFCMDGFGRQNPHILALDVDAGSAATLQLPLSDMIGSISDKETIVASVGGQLSLIIVGSLEVSIWMPTTSASASSPAWSRQLVIRTPEIDSWAGVDMEAIRAVLPVGGFSERSGSLVMQLKNGDLVRLDLGTKEATTLRKGLGRLEEVFLHEIDLPSLLQAMKSF